MKLNLCTEIQFKRKGARHDSLGAACSKLSRQIDTERAPVASTLVYRFPSSQSRKELRSFDGAISHAYNGGGATHNLALFPPPRLANGFHKKKKNLSFSVLRRIDLNTYPFDLSTPVHRSVQAQCAAG